MKVCPKCGKAGKNGASGMKFHIAGCGHDPIARFWSFVEKGDGCWLWTGAKHRDGYGRANVVLDGKLKIYIAHRIAWEFTYGPIPADRDVCHSCDARLCCKPAHLWLGTHAQNMDDMARKGRAGARGEKCIHAKLTEHQARVILSMKPAHYPRRTPGLAQSVADAHNVGLGAIHAIWRGHSWRHLLPPGDKQ